VRAEIRAGLASGIGLPAGFALLVATEAGIPVPVPSDFVALLFGERAAAGSIPLWLAVLALEVAAVCGTAALFLLCRGPGRTLVTRFGPRVGLTEQRLTRATSLVQRGAGALVLGRSSPGLRTITVVAAGGSELGIGVALPLLWVGSSLFLQAHLAVGYALGPAAERALSRAQGPVVLAVAVLIVTGIGFWILRRRRGAPVAAWTEAACPACLAARLFAAGENRDQ
jgi:membrane protein DedA with SNARE-associated domain